jgi:hypothetical protein
MAITARSTAQRYLRRTVSTEDSAYRQSNAGTTGQPDKSP